VMWMHHRGSTISVRKNLRNLWKRCVLTASEEDDTVVTTSY